MIIATGADYMPPDAEGREEFEGSARVFLVIRGEGLSATMSSYLSRRVETDENMRFCDAQS